MPEIREDTESSPVDPKRVKAFAAFFKRYMSVSTLVVASLPIPVTSLGIIPTFNAQTKLLSMYTSLFCFLTLGFIFYSRHQLARTMFPEHLGRKERARPIFGLSLMLKNLTRTLINLLPLLFIAASIVSVFQYNDVLNLSVSKIVSQRLMNNLGGPTDLEYILKTTSLNEIWYSSRLMILYISIFLTAEAAFIMMAIKEYLQDLVGLTEMDLISGHRGNF